MKIDFQILLDSIGFIQGTFLGILLLVLNKKNYKSTFFLGLFLLFFSLKLGHFISRNVYLFEDYQQLYLLPFNFSWLLFPLFFVYTQKVSVFSNRKPAYWVLVPGIVSFFAQLFLFFLPYQTKLEVFENPLHDIFFTYFGIVYSWCIALWNLRLVKQHKIEVHNTFSLVQKKELRWIHFFLVYSILVSLLIHVLYYISPQNYYFKIVFSIFDLVTIYWISYYGVSQPNVILPLVKDEINNAAKEKESDKSLIKPMPSENMHILIEQLDDYLISSACYTQTHLTIVDVAKSIDVHPKRISSTINSVRNQNFNTYINHFRIDKAIALLESNVSSDLSIEGIGNEVGFHSKSSFYSAFKKVTGITPTKYKNKQFHS